MKLLAILTLSFLLAGCVNPLTPEQRQAAVQGVELQYSTGAISKAERDVAIEKINRPSFDLNDLFPWLGVLLNAMGIPIVIGAVGKANKAQAQVDQLWDATHAPIAKA